MMSMTAENTIPPAPPDELLAELDAAARSLDELSQRGAELSLELDERTGVLRIKLEDEHGLRQLELSQLFSLLASGDL